MIYTIISIITFIVIFIFGSFIVPFYTPIRKKLIHIMEPKSQYNDNPVYDLLKSIENGSDSFNENLEIFFYWFLYVICCATISSLLAMAWPILVAVIPFSFLFNRIMIKNKNRNIGKD
jgi:hypothetical protein